MLVDKLLEEREKKGEAKMDVHLLLRAVFGPECENLDESLNENEELIDDVYEILDNICKLPPIGPLQWYLLTERYLYGTSKEELIAELKDNIDLLYDDLHAVSLRYLRKGSFKVLKKYLPETDE